MTLSKEGARILVAVSTALAIVAPPALATSLIPGPAQDGAIFYTAAITIVGAFFLLNAALRNRVGLYYAALFAVMLAVVWIVEGGLSRWSGELGEEPARALGLTIGLAAAALGFHVAERAFEPGRGMPLARYGLRGLALLSVILIFGAWYWPHDPMALTVDVLLLVMIAGHVMPVLTWQKPDGRPFRLPVVTVLALLLVVSVIAGIHAINENVIPGAFVFRWLFALVTIPTMGMILATLIGLRRSRDDALQAAVIAARKDAEMSASLLEMEKNYAQAREIAARRTRQISAASHDIRQPIAALRAELDGLKGEIAGKNADRLDRILDHFDAMTAELARSGGEAEALPGDTAETVPVALLFSMLERMFGAEAKAKGIELRFVASSRHFHAPALVLMRIASNLVHNAVNHSQAQRILIGTRMKGVRLHLDIIDNGIGFPESDIGARLAAGIKGAESGGAGLGLSIGPYL